MNRLSTIFSILVALSSLAAAQSGPTLTFLGRGYHLGSYNQTNKPTWEFITAAENIDHWTTLFTVIDRPDARTRPDLDHLAEGIMATYKSHNGQILSAKTMVDKAGVPFDYMVAAFEEPAEHRYELNFVKVVLGQKNALVLIYGVRLTDPADYRKKSKDFITEQSGPIGVALENLPLPDITKWPRKEF